MALEGGVALVTGATGGIGEAIVGTLVAAGMQVCITGRTQEHLDKLAADRQWSRQVEPFAVDLTAREAVQGFCDWIRHLHRAIHVLVHAAGAIVPGLIGDSRLDDFDRQYQINVRAPYQLTQELLPQLALGMGQIVFINSSAGLHAREGIAQYAATKHALRALADSLRMEMNEKGIRVLSVFLGRTATAMQAAVHAHEGESYRPERLVQPDDVASVVASALLLPRTAEITDISIRPMLRA